MIASLVQLEVTVKTLPRFIIPSVGIVYSVLNHFKIKLCGTFAVGVCYFYQKSHHIDDGDILLTIEV